MLFNKKVSKADASKLAKFSNQQLDQKSLTKVKGGEDKDKEVIIIDDLIDG